MSAALDSLAFKAQRYVTCAEAVFSAFANQEDTDFAWGLHQLASDLSEVVVKAMDSDDTEVMEEASLRCCLANGIFSKVAQDGNEGLLLAGEALMEAAKEAIDAEVSHRLSKGAQS